MRIFLIWLVIIACSVANGWFFSDFGSPEKFVFMFCAVLVCAEAISFHRRITADWGKHSDPWIDGFRFPIFRITMCISVLALIVLIIVPDSHSMETVACITLVVASLIAYIRERKYVSDWV